MTADWSTLSDAQLRCIVALDFAPPLHQTHLAKRHKVRGPTLESCIRLGLVRREYLHERDGSRTLAMPFLRLTWLGDAYKRDWIRWRQSAGASIAAAMGCDAASVEATLERGIGR